MSTIKEELEQIANVCITSKEFTDKAKAYLRNNKGIRQPIMSDSELRDIYRKVDYEREKKKAWDKYEHTIEPMLLKRADTANLWYEVWIDLEESWLDKWFASFRLMKDEEIVDVCAKYLNERERFYSSPDYYDMLDEMVKDIKDER